LQSNKDAPVGSTGGKRKGSTGEGMDDDDIIEEDEEEGADQ